MLRVSVSPNPGHRSARGTGIFRRLGCRKKAAIGVALLLGYFPGKLYFPRMVDIQIAMSWRKRARVEERRVQRDFSHFRFGPLLFWLSESSWVLSLFIIIILLSILLFTFLLLRSYHLGSRVLLFLWG